LKGFVPSEKKRETAPALTPWTWKKNNLANREARKQFFPAMNPAAPSKAAGRLRYDAHPGSVAGNAAYFLPWERRRLGQCRILFAGSAAVPAAHASREAEKGK
jgi:hypothetical protein